MGHLLQCLDTARGWGPYERQAESELDPSPLCPQVGSSPSVQDVLGSNARTGLGLPARQTSLVKSRTIWMGLG